MKRDSRKGARSIHTCSHDGANVAPLLANASATVERTARGKTLITSTRQRSGCLQASANIGDHSPTSPDSASRSMSHISGIKLRSPLLVARSEIYGERSRQRVTRDRRASGPLFLRARKGR